MAHGYLYHHEGSRKGAIHEAYDRAGGGKAGLQLALQLGASLKRDGKPLTEGTIRSWVSDWNSPNGYHARCMSELIAKEAAGRLEPGKSFRGFQDGTAQFDRAGGESRVPDKRRRAVNLSVSEYLLNEARALGLNLSQLFEDALQELVKAQRGRRWTEENKEFIHSYNAYIESNGVFGEDLLNLDDAPV